MGSLSVFFGYLFGILAGSFNNLGLILQKKSIKELSAQGEMKRSSLTKGEISLLIKNKTWLMGLLFIVGPGTLFLLLAQAIVGPSITPGLVAFGLIVLLIGSDRINGENIGALEYLSIFFIVVGIWGIVSANFVITLNDVDLEDSSFVQRLFLYSLLLIVLWVFLHYIGMHSHASSSSTLQKLSLGFMTGFPFALNNLWIQPFLLMGSKIFHSPLSYSFSFYAFFLFSFLCVGSSSLLGIWELQNAYKIIDASKVAPLQHCIMQSSPLFIYFYVYSFPVKSLLSLAFMLGGILFLLFGVLLASKKL